MQEWCAPNLAALRLVPLVTQEPPSFANYSMLYVWLDDTEPLEFYAPRLHFGKARYTEKAQTIFPGRRQQACLTLRGQEARALEATFEDLSTRIKDELRKTPTIGREPLDRVVRHVHRAQTSMYFLCNVSQTCSFCDLITQKVHPMDDMSDGPAVVKIRLDSLQYRRSSKTLAYKRGALHESWTIVAIQGLSKQRHIINLLMRGLDQLGYVFPNHFYARLYDSL